MPTAVAAVASGIDERLDEVLEAAELRARLRRFDYESERIAARHGLTPRRYLLLLMIKGAPDGSERSTVTQLAERLRLERHSVAELVGRAEAAGLIEREQSADDRRVAYLQLTEEGERRLAGAFGDHAAERTLLTELLP
ncbi:MAG TPA: MarR family transcriptional regulator [Thermoleophilaceae bacterium]|nr:MarR family transcriptional regulator [Thermoleophilaceae bacterium]